MILAYFLGSLWFILTKHTTQDADAFTFYNEYGLKDKTSFENLWIVVYFMFTTLSTVGFGDFHPKSEIERIMMTFILLIGVASFSYIMSQFISILLEVQHVTATNEESMMLSRWILLLKNFNNNKPLPPDVIAKFEAYFEYFWRNDKNYAIQTEDDMKLLDELPYNIQANIYKDFLFEDFLEQFKVYFYLLKPEVFQTKGSLPVAFEWDDSQYSDFMIRFLRALEPRYYEQGEYIFEAGEEVEESIYVISRDVRKPINSTGQYCIGFSVDQQTRYFHVKLGPKSIICNYENLFGKRAEYTYKAMMHVDAYGLRHTKLKPILDDEPDFREQMARYTLDFYHKIIRQPMLKFKKNILSQVSKRQDQDRIIGEVEQEMIDKEEEYERERDEGPCPKNEEEV